MSDKPGVVTDNQGTATTATATQIGTPPVSALVCTRNRGDSLLATIDSLLQNDYPEFEVIVVDQSTNEDTANALARYKDERRLRIIRSATKGLGRARNIGIAEARYDIIVMTDDDCEVPADWLARMAACFDHPKVAVAYCNVLAAPHDALAGFVPDYVRQGEQLMTTLRDKCRPNGIGAGMAVQRRVVEELGGFDEMLGAGAKFTAYEDVDIALRALLRGYYVFETDRVSVLHFGFRTLTEGRELTLRNYYGIGAGLGKLVKCGQWQTLRLVTYVLWDAVIAPFFTHIVRLKRPPVLRRFTALRAASSTP
jgi:glycosyltransferase involved in cell wall biosynthesis